MPTPAVASSTGFTANTLTDIDLSFSPAVALETAPIYDKLRTVVPAVEWPTLAPTIAAINRLKKQLGAVILAHNYMPPTIFHGVADLRGDSLALARMAADTISTAKWAKMTSEAGYGANVVVVAALSNTLFKASVAMLRGHASMRKYMRTGVGAARWARGRP